MADFLLRPGDRNVEAFSRLLQSRNPTDVFLLQAQWLRDMVDDYMKEVARSSDVYGRLFGTSWGLTGASYHARGMRSDRSPTPAARLPE